MKWSFLMNNSFNEFLSNLQDESKDWQSPFTNERSRWAVLLRACTPASVRLEIQMGDLSSHKRFNDFNCSSITLCTVNFVFNCFATPLQVQRRCLANIKMNLCMNLFEIPKLGANIREVNEKSVLWHWQTFPIQFESSRNRQVEDLKQSLYPYVRTCIWIAIWDRHSSCLFVLG